MPFCHQCGVEIGADPGARYCWSCGADQSEGAPAPAIATSNVAAGMWEDATTRVATIWDDPTTRAVTVYVAGAIFLALVAWLGGIEGVLLALPLTVGGVVALAKPDPVVRWLSTFESWTRAKHSRALTRQGRFSRWLVRPYLGGLQRIDSWTSRVDDESMRCGVRIAAYLYFSLIFCVAAFLAAYVALAVVVAIIMIIVMLWVLGEYLGADRPSYSNWRGRSAARERMIGSSVVRKGMLWDTPTGVGVNKEGQVVKEGVLFDSPTGVKINERGQIVREGWISDTPTGYAVNEQGEISKEGVLSDTPTGIRIGEDGEVMREGFLSDESTGVQFKKRD